MVVSAKSCELIKLLNENQVSPESDQENIFLMLPSISSLLSDIELEVFINNNFRTSSWRFLLTITFGHRAGGFY